VNEGRHRSAGEVADLTRDRGAAWLRRGAPKVGGDRGAISGPADLIGAHMSIAGGLPLALERGLALDCSAVQIFVKNQRQWAARPLGDAEAREFRAARRATGIPAVFAHGSYLINLGSPAEAAWRQAVDAFTDELERAEALGLACVAIHPGSHLGSGVPAGVARVAAAVREVLRRTRGYRVRVALEDTAGAGGTLGRTFAELGAMLDQAGRARRVGVCLDTCHLFAAGYDIRTEVGYRAAMAECAAAVGIERVLAFHLNDAKAPLGSGLDRHENIGQGQLGLTPFRCLLNDARFRAVPKVLETPKDPEPAADRRNLAVLRGLRTVSARRSRPPAGRAR
jgi:deoxyribonuclease-4